MQLLESWTLEHGSAERRIELLQGDLSRLPERHAVDVLVISAFRDDYMPTSGSVIGALNRGGLSVLQLSWDKEADLREEFSCWLSRPIESRSFDRILCVESGWRGEPPEITDDIFRALSPYLLTQMPNASVAMPIIGAGDAGWPADQMLKAILTSAVGWIQRGLPLRLLKIVAHSDESARLAGATFRAIRGRTELIPGSGAAETEPGHRCDVFLSYSHKDDAPARRILEALQRAPQPLQVFFDKGSLQPGGSWLLQVAESLDSARRVVALYTPEYWRSQACKDEFAAGLARQIDTGRTILFPIYFAESRVPYFFRQLHYQDCRERDLAKLDAVCSELVGSL